MQTLFRSILSVISMTVACAKWWYSNQVAQGAESQNAETTVPPIRYEGDLQEVYLA